MLRADHAWSAVGARCRGHRKLQQQFDDNNLVGRGESSHDTEQALGDAEYMPTDAVEAPQVATESMEQSPLEDEQELSVPSPERHDDQGSHADDAAHEPTLVHETRGAQVRAPAELAGAQ